MKSIQYDVNLSFFGGKPVKPGQWPARVDTEGIEHVKSLAYRGKQFLQESNLKKVMGATWMYQKNEIKNEELDVGHSNHHEPQAKKVKISRGEAGFIQDECAEDGQGGLNENEEDCQINCTAEDIAFIDDLLRDETSWEQYLNF